MACIGSSGIRHRAIATGRSSLWSQAPTWQPHSRTWPATAGRCISRRSRDLSSSQCRAAARITREGTVSAGSQPCNDVHATTHCTASSPPPGFQIADHPLDHLRSTTPLSDSQSMTGWAAAHENSLAQIGANRDTSGVPAIILVSNTDTLVPHPPRRQRTGHIVHRVPVPQGSDLASHRGPSCTPYPSVQYPTTPESNAISARNRILPIRTARDKRLRREIIPTKSGVISSAAVLHASVASQNEKQLPELLIRRLFTSEEARPRDTTSIRQNLDPSRVCLHRASVITAAYAAGLFWHFAQWSSGDLSPRLWPAYVATKTSPLATHPVA